MDKNMISFLFPHPVEAPDQRPLATAFSQQIFTNVDQQNAGTRVCKRKL